MKFLTSKKIEPLVVDLDGTLIYTDILYESTLKVLRDKPLQAFLIPFYLFKGKSALKQHLATHSDLDVTYLPYNCSLIDWLKHERFLGRKIILSTAADIKFANLISAYLGIFDEVIASDGVENNSGHLKASKLIKRFGDKGFDYIGNSVSDLHIWKHSRSAILVNVTSNLESRVKRICDVVKIFPKQENKFIIWFQVFRVQQWLKNLLLFVPIFAAHKIGNFELLNELVIAFISFGLCASAVYIANDLLDLESDRKHSQKHKRPFASGRIFIVLGVLLIPLLTFISFYIGHYVGSEFLTWLVVYFVLTFAYSLWLKRIVLIDCLLLAILYTIRIVAGGAAVGIPISFWLLAFSIFLFFSLAFVKRFVELQSQPLTMEGPIHGRGYLTSDISIIQALGITSGFISVLVLALYINSMNVVMLYKLPQILWATVPLMLLWISWVWMKAHREEMHHDPIVFAFKDNVSIVIGLLFATVFVVAQKL